jgi:hypothetical protein
MSAVDDYTRGVTDCANAVAHTPGTDEYNRGYADQYAHEPEADHGSEDRA